jgi:hypothetical protein
MKLTKKYVVLIPKVMCSITYIYGIKKYNVPYSDYFVFSVHYAYLSLVFHTMGVLIFYIKYFKSIFVIYNLVYLSILMASNLE